MGNLQIEYSDTEKRLIENNKFLKEHIEMLKHTIEVQKKIIECLEDKSNEDTQTKNTTRPKHLKIV